MRVLIVDDNEELRGFLVLSLTEAGVEAVAARDADDALRQVEAEKFDVLIIDSVMGAQDGITLAQQVRATKNGRTVPIILMSSVSTALARRIAKDVGCNEFLVKPFGQMQFID